MLSMLFSKQDKADYFTYVKFPWSEIAYEKTLLIYYGVDTLATVHPYLSLAQWDIVTFCICIAPYPIIRNSKYIKNNTKFPDLMNFP